MRKFTIMLALLLFAGLQVVLAQRTITGTITSSDDGEPIPGATVVVKNTTIGTTTNADGYYELSVPDDARALVISFVGMVTQEIQIGESNVVNVTLEPDIMDIEGVVVTALGITREKKALGYAVQDVKGDELAAAKESNIVNSLSGKVSGVQVISASGAVGASSRVVIRGNNSFGNNQPLFVVDGVPISNYSSNVSQWEGVDFGNAAMDLDPENIESVSVLKGANAAALYGSRAANGVILITTKSGERGARKGIGVSYNTSFQWDNVSYTPLYQNKYGQGVFGSEYFAKQAGVDPSDIAAYEAYAEANGFNYYDGTGTSEQGVYDGVDESWGPRLDIGLNLRQFDSPLADPNDPDTRQKTPWVSHPDNVKDFFQTGFTWDNNLAFTGGTEKAAARLALGYRDTKGAIPNTDLTRYTVNFSGSQQLSDKFTASVTTTFVQNKSDNLPGGGYDANNIMQSIGSWFGRQVDMQSLEDNWDTYNVFGNPYNWNTNYHNNPYWTVNKNTTSRVRNRIFGNVMLEYQFTDFLKLMGRVGTDYFNENRKHVVADKSNESSFGGSFWEEDRRMQETNADVILSYDQDVSEDWALRASIGANYMNRAYHFKSIEASELTVPDLFTIGNARGTPTVEQLDEERETNSLFGTFGIGWKRMLYLDLTGRNDWSSTLPKDNWSYFYPSASLSWVFSETWDINPMALTFGKVRLSYAQVGNSTDPYQIVPTFSSSASQFSGIAQYFYTRELPPLDLLPEESNSMEFGFDLKFLNNRLGLDYTYYDIATKNQILAVDISKASGFENMRLNAGEIRNWGHEIMLTGKILKSTRGLNWDITVNWSKNNNRVEELFGDLEAYQISSSWGAVTIEARPGETYGVIKGGGYVRDDAGNIIVGTDGLPVHSPSPVEIGNITPDFIGGVRNTFRWRNLNLSFLIDFRKGGDVFSVTDWFGAYAGVTEETAEGDIRENGMTVEGVYGQVDSEGTVTYLNANGEVSEGPVQNTTITPADYYFWDYWGLHEPSIIDGSFIKFREFILGYDFPKDVITKTGFIQSLNISVYGRNLALLWRHESNDVRIDPETGFGTANSGMGLEQYQLPPVRNIGVKFQFTF